MDHELRHTAPGGWAEAKVLVGTIVYAMIMTFVAVQAEDQRHVSKIG